MRHRLLLLSARTLTLTFAVTFAVTFALSTTAAFAVSLGQAPAADDEPYASAHESWGLPASPTGRRLASVLEMFAKKDEATARRFLSTALDRQFLTQIGIDDVMRQTVMIWTDLGDFELNGIEKTGPTSARALVTTESGDSLAISIDLEPDPPHRISGLGVDAHDGGSGLPAFSSLAEVDAFAREQADDDELSGVVLVAVDDEIVFERAYGLADRAAGRAVTTDTAFDVGSITKDFTRTAILQLEAAGELELDDHLGKFLPDFPPEMRDKVTVRQLLEMTSGFGDYLQAPEFRRDPNAFSDLDDLLALIRKSPLEFEPGSSRRYSNSGYAVLGGIIAAASGMDYHDYIQENVFAEAGMTGSRFLEERGDDGVAIGYTRRGDELVPNSDILPAKGSPAGSSYSTARDLLAFQIALREGKLDAGTDAYRPGCWAGGAPGVSAIVCTGERPGQHVVVLSNTDPPLAERLGERIARRLGDGELSLDGGDRGAGP